MEPEEVSEQMVSDAFPAVVPVEPVEPTPEEIAREEARVLSQRALQHRAEMYVELAKGDAFKSILGELATKKERMNREFADGLLAGEAVNQRQIDYDRGFIDGLGYISKMIEGAENLLKRVDREAARQEESTSEPDDNEGVW